MVVMTTHNLRDLLLSEYIGRGREKKKFQTHKRLTTRKCFFRVFFYKKGIHVRTQNNIYGIIRT